LIQLLNTSKYFRYSQYQKFIDLRIIKQSQFNINQLIHSLSMEPNKQENQNNLSGGIFSGSGGLFGNVKFNQVSEPNASSKASQLSGK